MEFLDLSDIKANKSNIESAYRSLLENIPGIRCKSKQWRFFDLCFRRTFEEIDIPNDLVKNANYYKFEVQNILERYYLKGFKEIDYVFSLKHKKDIDQLNISFEGDAYPCTCNYYLLVRALKPGEMPDTKITAVKEYILKVVYEGIKAEFNAYKSLPDINDAPLASWFNEDGSAYKEIMSNLLSLQKREWVLTNHFNPSHHLIKSLKLTQFNGNHALVKTVEYYYLKWFQPVKNEYTYVYRETNTQTYQLILKDGKWLIEANLRRLPLTSLPRRQAEYIQKNQRKN